MTTAAQLRKTAGSLPEAVADGGAFTVGGVVFAALADKQAELRLPAAEVAEVLAAHPSATRVRGGVRVPLADINGQQLNHWVRRAWLAHAPEPLAARARAAESAEPGTGDLPRAIGRPATRAIADAGITTLDQVAALTEAELLALHGMGPKAMRILREALAETGRSLAG
ncbi:helix-hairpin-helix domain-containing protein [Amycolatopsis ruanii]|uniref:helix-hairpin-helix domain-containing protein n=1 Tax=Amycolatopsis ruanii TaxID=944491 RepID=UPI000E22035C|nr:helix-hairpin-helix domain-containing protein [Amycolatopsis ruanii]